MTPDYYLWVLSPRCCSRPDGNTVSILSRRRSSSTRTPSTRVKTVVLVQLLVMYLVNEAPLNHVKGDRFNSQHAHINSSNNLHVLLYYPKLNYTAVSGICLFLLGAGFNAD